MGEVERKALELSKLIKNISEFRDGENRGFDPYESTYTVLGYLGDFDENLKWLAKNYYLKNRIILDKIYRVRIIGHLIESMEKYGCSNEQAFAFFSTWSGKSRRQVAQYYYDYRAKVDEAKELDAEKNIEGCTFYVFTVVFFIIYYSCKGPVDFKNIEGNCFTGALDWANRPMPDNFPSAKRALAKSFEEFVEIGKRINSRQSVAS